MRNERLRKFIGAQVNLDVMAAAYPQQHLLSGQEVRPHITFDGKEVLQFASLDYLGLATDPRVVEAGVQAMRQYGMGALASRLVSDLKIHRDLELKIAEFMNADDSVVFTSGSVANQGTIQALIASPLAALAPGSNTHVFRTVFSDALTHSSIKDGVNLARGSRTRKVKYKSGDMVSLEHFMKTDTAELKIVITDGIFSTNGRVAPLPEICRIAEKYGAIVYVDDAHATGVLGENGRGSCELLDVEDKVDVRMGVISKALGTMGGFIVGESWFIQYLRHSQPQIHSMPLPPAECAATIKAIEIAQSEPWRRQTVLALAERLRSGFQEIGFDILGSTTQVVPILIGDEMTARSFADELFEERGIFCPPFEYPAVPEGEAVIRFCPSALHKEEDIDRLLDALADMYKKYPITRIDKGLS